MAIDKKTKQKKPHTYRNDWRHDFKAETAVALILKNIKVRACARLASG